MASTKNSDEHRGERIAKVMARAGVCSRREAERWIEAGRVKVDGAILTSPACCVTPKNQILVDDQPLPGVQKTRIWLYHKPSGLVTTHQDPQGRPTVFEALPNALPRVISVGRLDQNSEGLLLLTNDGALARSLELPISGLVRIYKVRVFGRVSQKDLEPLKKGLTIEGVRYQEIQTKILRQQGQNCWIEMRLKEGKNREIRRVLSFLGWPVNRLIRLSYGPYRLGDLKPGAVKEVTLNPDAKQEKGQEHPHPSSEV